MGEPELIFHDTVPIEEERLPEARNTARKQKEWILAFFRDRFSMNFTPIEVHQEMKAYCYGSMCLLTSVRRAITDLTKEGKLTKCDYSERREGGYGHPNRVWKYNVGWLPSLNRK
jgi:hypothetical protein